MPILVHFLYLVPGHPYISCKGCHETEHDFLRKGGFSPLHALCQPLCPRRFCFPLHQLPQRGINAGLIVRAVLLEPGDHVGVEPQRDRLLQRTVEIRNLHRVQLETQPLRCRCRQIRHLRAAPPCSRSGTSCAGHLGRARTPSNSFCLFHLGMYQSKCTYNIVP